MFSAQQSQPTPQEPESTDQIMAEAPDSPPEISHLPAPAQSFTTHLTSSAQPTSSRVNGEAAKVNHGAPGSTWSTKKYQDEYDRACSSLVDQNWDNRKYGDTALDSKR